MTKQELLSKINGRVQEATENNFTPKHLKESDKKDSWIENVSKKSRDNKYIAELLYQTVGIIENKDYECLFEIIKTLDEVTKENLDKICADLHLSQNKKWIDLELPFWVYLRGEDNT